MALEIERIRNDYPVSLEIAEKDGEYRHSLMEHPEVVKVGEDAETGDYIVKVFATEKYIKVLKPGAEYRRRPATYIIIDDPEREEMDFKKYPNGLTEKEKEKVWQEVKASRKPAKPLWRQEWGEVMWDMKKLGER